MPCVILTFVRLSHRVQAKNWWYIYVNTAFPLYTTNPLTTWYFARGRGFISKYFAKKLSFSWSLWTFSLTVCANTKFAHLIISLAHLYQGYIWRTHLIIFLTSIPVSRLWIMVISPHHICTIVSRLCVKNISHYLTCINVTYYHRTRTLDPRLCIQVTLHHHTRKLVSRLCTKVISHHHTYLYQGYLQRSHLTIVLSLCQVTSHYHTYKLVSMLCIKAQLALVCHQARSRYIFTLQLIVKNGQSSI